MTQWERREAEQLADELRAGNKLSETQQVMYDYFVGSGKEYLFRPRATPDYPSPSHQVLNSSERRNRTLPSSLPHSSASPPGPLEPGALGPSPPPYQPETPSGHYTLQCHSNALNALNATSPQPGSPGDTSQHQLEFPGHAASSQHQPTSSQRRPESLGPFSPLQHLGTHEPSFSPLQCLGTHEPSEAASRHSSQPPESQSREVVEPTQVESSFSSEVVQAVSDLKKCLLQNAERIDILVTCLQEQTEQIKRLTEVLETLENPT
ncbi:hypothetical protein K435DRAFT_798977 [Dendrothele bispora CBS 962.96]|uniref:Uncharacterized protein n=1 Tax=Dendrothele bispora (strain CBS 962.96) TaxID=1314807 RepID=A0A4S8LYN8_DENBC|nr:hypothetical protein K435DRAFT_798977 [Dendrothele bispora CBS 962.96]